MTADKILNKIISDAKAEAQAIVNEANARAKAAEDAIMHQARKKAETIAAAAEEECAETHRRAVLMNELEARKSTLAAKRGVLDEAYALAAEKLSKLSGAAWENLIVRIVLESAQTGTETLMVNEADRARFSDAFMAKLNAMLLPKGCSGGLTLSQTSAPISGGVILVSEASEINGSFEALLRQAREETESEAARLLFGPEVV